MRNKLFNSVLALGLILAGLLVPKVAQASTETAGWQVSYDGTEITSDYDIEKSTITSVMPGDTVIFSVDYTNDSDKTADFYLNTDVINSLEEKNADGSSASVSGGAYSYKLSYILDGNTTVLYDSKTIGGDNSLVVGLNQIEGVEDKNTYFDVGQLPSGAKGTVQIEIVLDGNSQDNAYMQKLAALDVRFGVAEPKTDVITNVITKTETNRVVYTVPGGTEVVVMEEPVVVIEDSTVPLVGPVTGDMLLPIIICTVSLMVGLGMIIWYQILSKKSKREGN